MIHTPLNIIFKVTLLLLLLSSVTSKSISERNENTNVDIENEVEHTEAEEKVMKTEQKMNHTEEFDKEKQVKQIENAPEKPKEEIVVKSSENPPANETKEQGEPPNDAEGHKGIDPTATTDTSDIARNSRNIGRLREVDSPATLIENFRNKLKTARSNLEGSLLARKAAEPRIFLFDPNADKLKPLLKPTLSTFARTVPDGSTPVETSVPPAQDPQKEEQSNIKKLITSPTIDDSSSSSEEHKKTVKSSSKARQNPEAQPVSEEISHLLVVREEINKIRHMMQVLREQQLRQQFGAQFPFSRNLTEEETKDLSGVIEGLKDQGKISTKPMNPQLEEDADFQNHPPETTKLIEDIKKLKESVFSFAKQVGGPKGTIGSIEELEKQIQQQKEEIESLKKLVDDLQPPRHFPSNPVMIKHPQNVKSDLHLELRSLQDILNELLKKEEEKEKLQLRSAMLDSNKPKTDEEISTLLKIFQSMRHVNSEGRQSSTLETKLDKLERELREMDTQHQRTRQEFKLQKLEQDIKSIKGAPVQNEDLQEKIRRLEESLGKNQQLKVSAKISALENQLKQISDKPQSRSLVFPGDIEKELDNLQREIDLMTLKNLQSTKTGPPMSSRQLESLFSDILSPSVDDTPHDSTASASIDKLKGIIKAPMKPITISHDIQPVLPSKTPDIPSKTGYAHPPIYQLPYCLQKYPHSAPYVAHNPQYHPYPPSVPSVPVVVEKNKYQPIKTQDYGQYPAKVETPKKPSFPVKVPQTYAPQPVKVEERPYNAPQPSKVEERPYNGQQSIKGYNKEPFETNQQQISTEQEYNNEDYKPIKNQNEAIGYNNGQSGSQKYNNKEISEPQSEIKPIIHHVYQPAVPKATPVKIEYHHPQETDDQQEYGYPAEEMQYQQYKPTCQHHAHIQEEINHLNGMIGDLDEKIDYSQDLEPNYEMYRTKNYKPRSKRQVDYDYDKKTLYKDIKQRLATLREAVESAQENQSYPNVSENDLSSDFQRSATAPDYYQPYDPKDSYAVKIRKKQKFDNLFIKIVKFILHKLEISAPLVVESLFDGEAFDHDNDGYNGYRSSKNMRSASEETGDYNSEENEVQKNLGGLFNNFQGFHGLLGFIPTILFKLLSNFSSFLSILKRNNFFKNFLFPGALILVVDGIMALLVWWFSTDENHNVLTYLNNNVNQQY